MVWSEDCSSLYRHCQYSSTSCWLMMQCNSGSRIELWMHWKVSQSGNKKDNKLTQSSVALHSSYHQPKNVHLILVQPKAWVTATTTMVVVVLRNSRPSHVNSAAQGGCRGACKIISGYHTHLPVMSVCKLFNGFGLVQPPPPPNAYSIRSGFNVKCCTRRRRVVVHWGQYHYENAFVTDDNNWFSDTDHCPLTVSPICLLSY